MLQPLADALRRNPFPLYSALRRASPVLRVPGRPLWMLYDFESVKRALHDPATFSSRAAPPGGKPLDWLIFLDPPLHTKLRALVMRTFTPRAVASLEPRIEALTHELLDKVIARGTMDLATEFSAQLPLLVICELLGAPVEDRELLSRWSDVILHLGDMIYGGERAAKASADYRAVKDEMQPYVERQLAERRVAPRDDLLTRLLEATVDGERLTEEEILNFFQLLLLAGSETTTNLISNAMLSFIAYPDQLARLRAAPELLPSAIEEVLRFRAPLQMVFRNTACDVELHRRVIPAGHLVLVMVGSANRDPKQFKDPARFDITRSPNAHIAFGHGAHFCIGSALARLEAKVALPALLARLRDVQLVGPWVPHTAVSVHGPRKFPIRFTPV
ncbi:MAG: cytochrome P450 [bacterium]